MTILVYLSNILGHKHKFLHSISFANSYNISKPMRSEITGSLDIDHRSSLYWGSNRGIRKQKVPMWQDI